MGQKFRVGITRDFLKPDGSLAFGDIGVSLLESAAGIEWEFLAEEVRELSAGQVKDYDALVVLAPRLTAATLAGVNRLAVIARFGVGYDSIDVPACTRAAMALTITPDGVRRPVAAAAMTFILALTHKLLIKDRLTRHGRWADRIHHMGMGLAGRTLGVVGLGNIGRELLMLAKPFGMQYLAHDPYMNPEDASRLGAQRVDLETLMHTADYVCITCALTPETHHLINAERLALMKPTAYLVNVARGPIVDQAALTAALRERRIQGAGLDVFEEEPVSPDDPILKLENAIFTPHAICWTDECFRGNGRSACESVLDVAAGRPPRNVVNRAVLEDTRFKEKLRHYGQNKAER